MSTKYTREDRYKAAAAFVATGNSIAASNQSGIPASTIRHWSQHDEDFQMMCLEVKAEFGEEIKSKLAQIVNEAADQTLDRLQNGDVVRDAKSGELVRVPIKGKDAAVIGAIAFDKLRLAENQPTNIVKHEDTTANLKRLADKFKALSSAHQNRERIELERQSEKSGTIPVPDLLRDEGESELDDADP